MATMDDNGSKLERDLRDHAWETAQGKLNAPAKVEFERAVAAWLAGSMTVEDAAAAVRSVVPLDPATVPLNPRHARVVDGRLYKKSGKLWLAGDGSVLQADA